MAVKKDFSTINTEKVFNSIETATSRKGQQGTASPEEAAQRAAQLRTQGRKGCKAVRINMAFTPENYDFVKIAARATGQTMTKFANQIIEQYRADHAEDYKEAKKLFEKFSK